jgi:hypothetical protein
MPDDIELSFLRKFIERQATGIPHNPRLRNAVGPDGTYIPREHSMEAFSPEGTSQDFLDHRQTTGTSLSASSPTYTCDARFVDAVEDALQRATSPSFRSAGGLAAEAISSSKAYFILTFGALLILFCPSRTSVGRRSCITSTGTKRDRRFVYEIHIMP